MIVFAVSPLCGLFCANCTIFHKQTEDLEHYLAIKESSQVQKKTAVAHKVYFFSSKLYPTIYFFSLFG